MPLCLPKKKRHFDFKKEPTKDLSAPLPSEEKVKVKWNEVSPSGEVAEVQPLEQCVEDLIFKGDMKKMMSKWNSLKRVRDMYDEQVSMRKIECFRAKILKHMKDRLKNMSTEERKIWLTKLLRLSFLYKLNDIKYLKEKRRNVFLEKLETAKGDERENLLAKINELKDIYEMKEIDDVNDVLDLKKAKKEKRTKKCQALEMKIRLNRLKKMDEIKRKEEKNLREERVDKVKEVLTVKKNWQEDMIKKIDTVTTNIVEELVTLKDKEEWFQQTKKELEVEKEKLELDEAVRIQSAQLADTIEKDIQQAKKKREQKIKEIETWNKERKVRLWKLERVKKFEDFLESRYKLAETDENVFFKKIFKKLSVSERKNVPVDPWAMRLKLDDRQKEAVSRKKHNDWINSIISSTKGKVVKNVMLKKYLEIMETPQFDKMMAIAEKVESIHYLMTIVRGRIFKSTFPEKIKHYIAKELGLIVTKAKLDVRNMDPTDKLLNIQLTTKNHELYLTTGDEYLVIVQQKIEAVPVACQGRTDQLCITKNERDKMLEIIKKRQECRKVIKERRLKEFEAYLNRKALDDAWIVFLKKAYGETVKSLEEAYTCKRGDDEIGKIEVIQQDRTIGKDPSKTEVKTTAIDKEGYHAAGLTEMQIKALVYGEKGTTLKLPKKEFKYVDYETAMDMRVERLKNLVEEKVYSDKVPYYMRPKDEMKDILHKEKVVRGHMIKNLPEPDEFD